MDHAGETLKTTFDRKDDVACVEFSTADSARQIAPAPSATDGRAGARMAAWFR